MERLEAKGAKGFILRKEVKSIGGIDWGRKQAPRTHQFFFFGDIKRTLAFINSDRCFLLGNEVLERIDGLAMGQATSPPTTAYDLDYNSRKCIKTK